MKVNELIEYLQILPEDTNISFDIDIKNKIRIERLGLPVVNNNPSTGIVHIEIESLELAIEIINKENLKSIVGW